MNHASMEDGGSVLSCAYAGGSGSAELLDQVDVVAGALDAMQAVYAAVGVTRFAAWAHESDEAMRGELERRGLLTSGIASWLDT